MLSVLVSIVVPIEEGLSDVGSVVIFDTVEVDIWALLFVCVSVDNIGVVLLVLVIVSWLLIVELDDVLSVLGSIVVSIEDVASVVIFDTVEVDISTLVISVVSVSAVEVGVSWLLVVELSDVASVVLFDIVEVNIWALVLSVIWVDVDVVVDLMIIVVPLPFG